MTLIIGIHIVFCVLLMLVILLQSGEKADLAGAFGGGGSQTALGARGAATFLSKATTWLFIAFMATSILLTIIGSRPDESVLDEAGEAAAVEEPAPETPGESDPAAPAATPEETPAEEAPEAGEAPAAEPTATVEDAAAGDSGPSE